MPEYLRFRCCMCPNTSNPENTQCPSGTACRFVKTYIDSRGWKYRVMPRLGKSNLKAIYQKPGTSSWKWVEDFEWCESFDDAQSDLNEYAKSKGWEELK